jgi:DNA-directed RNA polymerase beta' subunit
MPKILDYTKFCENLPEVTSVKTMGKRRFHDQGLFSESIFGLVENYTCYCRKYHGPSKVGQKCDECKIEITNSDERRKRFAQIRLPIPVVNPLFYDLLISLGGKSLKNSLNDLMRNEKSILYIIDEKIYVSCNPEMTPAGVRVYEKAEAIIKLVENSADELIAEGFSEWKVIKDNIGSLMIDRVLVLPPDLRPTTKIEGEQSKQLMDQINRYYVQILTKKEVMRQTTININNNKDLYYTYFRQLQMVVNELYTHILDKLSKKEGLIRGNILGKRIDFSGRAVIVPDPTINIDECVLPYVMVLEIFKLQIAKRLIELGKYKLLNKAISAVEYCIEKNIPAFFDIAEYVTKDEVCILNRQPSLHRLSMLGFKIKVSLDNIIKVPPLICSPYNADFDGDQMAVYVPITPEAKQEVIEKMFVTRNFFSPSNEKLTTTPNQDVILGIYFVTMEKTPVENGRDLFQKCLPPDFRKINQTIKKKELLEILDEIKENYPSEVVASTLDGVKRLGFKFATHIGTTMSIEDFRVEESSVIKSKIYGNKKTKDQLVASLDRRLDEYLKRRFKYSYIIESGARGSWDQVKQLVLTRGFISNFEGEILPIPIKSSLLEGLNEEEFFYSTYGARKGLLDVALNTGVSGYLSRKLIFACANLQLDKELDDCGTEDFLNIRVTTDRKARMLVRRYIKHEKGLKLITKENYKELIGEDVEVRSPIFCQSPKICKTCYGDLYKTLNTKFIGIVAAQTLGERSTQLVLRTFHTSGSASIKGGEQKEGDLRQGDIIGDLASVSKMLHKFEEKDPQILVEKLFDAHDKDIYHVHFECVVAQLMWKNQKKWRLLPNRKTIEPDYYSIQSVPSQESWILAMAFSNPKRSILNGIMDEGKYSGIMDKILKGEKI